MSRSVIATRHLSVMNFVGAAKAMIPAAASAVPYGCSLPPALDLQRFWFTSHSHSAPLKPFLSAYSLLFRLPLRHLRFSDFPSPRLRFRFRLFSLPPAFWCSAIRNRGYRRQIQRALIIYYHRTYDIRQCFDQAWRQWTPAKESIKRLSNNI